MKKGAVGVENLSMSKDCWSCGTRNEGLIFCRSCGKIQPPSIENPFEIFGLSPHVRLDLEALERQYFLIQNKVHPDRFVHGTLEEKRYSQEHSERLNRAYKSLQKSATRLQEFLKWTGVSLEEDTDPVLLMDVMEWRQRLELAENSQHKRMLREDLMRSASQAEAEVDHAFGQEDWSALYQLALRFQYMDRILDELKVRRFTV